MILDRGSPPEVAADPRSSMGPRPVPSYSGCQVTRSNSLPSGSAKVVWRIAYEVTGSGPLVVLSHSIGDRRQAYRFLAPTVAQAARVRK